MPDQKCGEQVIPVQVKVHEWVLSHHLLLNQIISKPVYVLPTFLSYIDILFTDQPNVVVDCVVHSELNLKVRYSTTHQRLVCRFKRVSPTSIRKSVEIVY